MQATVAFLVVAGISFLFTTVAANAIAIVGTNPVSGMTLMTLILASVILVAVGLKGTVIEPLMMGQGAPWMLYGIGAILAVLLTWLNVPALAFALGMFIPLELNTPLVIGGLISWYVGSRSKDTALNKARLDKGTLLASGFIAGGALMGVVSAGMKFAGFEYTHDLSEATLQTVGLIMYLLLIAFLTISSMKAKKQD